jgi:predicted PurR-regulated permease PerM
VGLGADAARNAASIVIDFAIMIFLLFYLLRDGKQMVHTIKYLSPLRSDQEDRIVSRMRMVTRSAILGNFLTALAQGVAGGIGFAIVGIPAFFWGAVLGLASFVPVVGTTLVWGPAVIYLVVIGNWKLAIFLFVWSAVLVGSIDNFLRPFFMRGGAEMSPFYIFLSLLGGIQIFGLAGIIYGPLIIAFAKVMIYIYQVEYKDLLDENEGGRFTGPDEADEDASAENA